MIKPIIKLNIKTPKEPTMSITSNRINIPYFILLGFMYALQAKYRQTKNIAKIRMVIKTLNALISKPKIVNKKAKKSAKKS